MSELPRKRQGLEGVPVSSAEVVAFDTSRLDRSSAGVLVVCWLIVGARWHSRSVRARSSLASSAGSDSHWCFCGLQRNGEVSVTPVG